MRNLFPVLKAIGLGLLAVVAALLVISGVWFLRPNGSQIAPGLQIETWDVVSDGRHNSNTDMVLWAGHFYLIYASSPFHFASQDSRLVLLRSDDARAWETVAEFNAAGEDIRDPKLAVIGGRLFLYALKNTEFTAEPYMTVYAVSNDGLTWTPFEEMEPRGWLFWRPKTLDGETWYLPAYWHEHGRAALLSSTNGVEWAMVAQIHEGDRSDETDIEFLPDGRMLATARLEISDSWLGDPEGSTLITVASPPYTEWTDGLRSPVTRLDGPNLFSYNGRTYGVGRYQPAVHGPFVWQGSILARKRTALFLVRDDGLIHLSDLPSAGDTSYAGVALQGSDLYICYYTSPIDRDYPWVLGMVTPSPIRLAHVDLGSLEALAVNAEGRFLP